MNTKHEPSDIQPSNLFLSQSGTKYDIEEIIASFEQHHYLFDFKNTINSSHNRPFSEHDVNFLMQNYPKLKSTCIDYYNDHILIGLIFKQSQRDELFCILQELHVTLTKLIDEYNWAWIPDNVLAIELSVPLDKLYQFTQTTNIKFIEFIVTHDFYLNTFMRGGLKDYLSKIHDGGCLAGFVEAFSRIYAQALTCKSYVDIQSQNKNLNSTQAFSATQSVFFPNADNKPEQDNNAPKNSI